MPSIVTPYKKYDLTPTAARRSGLLAKLEDSNSSNEIVLTEKFLTDMVMLKVISFLMGREENNVVHEGIPDDEVILSTILAADYLQIPELLEGYSSLVVSALRDSNSADEVRWKLKIKKDFNFEEEVNLEQEDPWKFRKEDIYNGNEDGTFIDAEEENNPDNINKGGNNIYSAADEMSVSMMVDDSRSSWHSKKGGSPYPPPFATPVETDIVQFVQPRRPVAPVPDDQASVCSKCGGTFSSLVRKHHCRHCGRIFCGTCSSKSIALPKAMNIYRGYSTPYITTVKSWVTWASSVPAALYSGKEAGGGKHRVCDSCFDTISEQEKLAIHIQGLRVLALDFPQLKRAGTICSNWRRATIYCLSLLREIQYQLPTGQLNEGDKKLLWVNRWHLAGHSKWLVQLLKVVDWTTPEASAQAVDILVNHKRKHSCWRLMCSRSCEERLNAGDALLLLNEDMPNMEVRNFAVRALATASDTELLCFLPVLVHALRYADPSSLVDFLLKKAMAHEQICYDLFWALSLGKESKQYKRLYDSVQHKLIITLAAVSQERAMQLVNGQDLIAFLEGIPTGVTTTQLQALLARKIDSDYVVPLPLPVDPLIKVTNLNWGSVVVKQSATAPIVVPCISTTPQALNTKVDENVKSFPTPSAPPISTPSSVEGFTQDTISS